MMGVPYIGDLLRRGIRIYGVAYVEVILHRDHRGQKKWITQLSTTNSDVWILASFEDKLPQHMWAGEVGHGWVWLGEAGLGWTRPAQTGSDGRVGPHMQTATGRGWSLGITNFAQACSGMLRLKPIDSAAWWPTRCRRIKHYAGPHIWSSIYRGTLGLYIASIYRVPYIGLII